MLARLDAGERLARISDGAIAAGNMPVHDRARLTGQLRETERGTPQRPARATAAVLGRMGIRVSSVRSAASEKGISRGG